jgi:hypothetical protein
MIGIFGLLMKGNVCGYDAKSGVVGRQAWSPVNSRLCGKEDEMPSVTVTSDGWGHGRDMGEYYDVLLYVQRLSPFPKSDWKLPGTRSQRRQANSLQRTDCLPPRTCTQVQP